MTRLLRTAASGVTKAKLEEELLLYALLAGRVGGQKLYGGTATGNKLELFGNSVDATDVVTWHSLLEGPSIKATGVEATEVKAPTISKVTKLQLEGTAEITGAKTLELLEGGLLRVGYEELILGAISGSSGAKVFAIEASQVWENKNEVNVVGFKPTAEWTIEGIKSLTVKDGQVLILWNASTTQNLILEHEKAGLEPSEKFKFSTGANIKLKPGEYLTVQQMKAAGGLGRGWREKDGSLRLAPGTTYTAGEGLELSGTSFLVKAAGVTNAMLAGSIEDAKLLLTTVVKLTGAQEVKGVKTFAEELVANGTITGKAITGTSGVFTTTLKVKETLTAEGAATVAKTLKVTELTTTTGGLTVEGTLTLPAESVKSAALEKLSATEAKIGEEAVSGKKIKTGTPEAAKELKAATKIKGITGSSTIVYISALLKAEATTGEIIADGKKVYALLTETLAASSKVLYFSFKMKAGAEFELKFTTGALEGATSVYVLQEG